jgi:hypothetical protein
MPNTKIVDGREAKDPDNVSDLIADTRYSTESLNGRAFVMMAFFLLLRPCALTILVLVNSLSRM